jgi:hypothetical protein
MAALVMTNPLQTYAADFQRFAADLHVPLGAASGRLGDHWGEFQQTDFAAVAPAMLAVARGEVAPVRRHWWERTKGASKDSDCAVVILWLLAFAPRAVRIQVGAYDREQASELRYIIKAILAIDAPLNRLLAEVIEVQQYRILGHGSTAGRVESVCEILTTDAFGSHGSRPDVVVANELSHVGSEAFMQTLFDNADKVPHSLVIVATNAGEVGSWQEQWRDIAAETPERWHFSVVHEPAPWISEADLAESRRRNPPHRFNRLWKGVWSSGEGDGLNPDDIAACTTLAGRPPRNYKWTYCAALDLGVKNDHSALCILGVDAERGQVVLANVVSWRPEDYGGTVDLMEVEHCVLTAHKLYGFRCVGYDPWQCNLMAQRLASQGVPMREVPFTAGNKDEMARALLNAFTNRLIALYPDKDLERDLLRLRIKEGPLGYRLDAVKDADGHADRAIALSIILPGALFAATGAEVSEHVEEVLVL